MARKKVTTENTVKTETTPAAETTAKKTTATKTTAAKTTAAKRTTVKAENTVPAAETVAVVETAAETVPAAETTTVAETAAEVKVFVQCAGKESEEVVNKAKAIFVAAGNKESDIKTIDIYVKTEENAAYFAINGVGSDDYKVEL